MVDTIKFSEMPNAGNINNNDIMPSLRSGENVILNNPWTFLPPGTTADRPTPSSTVNYRLRLNTDLQLYEYYDAVLGAWTQLQESAFTAGPFITYTADPSLPDAQNLGLLANGILKQTITLGVATVDIAVNEVDYYGPGMTGYLQAPAGVKDSNGNIVVNFGSTASAVNFVTITNNSTGQVPLISAAGTDTNVGLVLQGKGTGGIGFRTANTTVPFNFYSGTNAQHTTNFAMADTAANRTATWQDSDGTVAWLTDVMGTVTSAQGTANQVLVNGTSGSPVTGAIILTTPQNIGTTSTPTFGGLTLTSPLTGANGGTGVNNGASTITLGGSLSTIGAFTAAFTMTGNTAVTFPTTGTLATTSQLPTPSALTKTDDTNVTLTLGGSPTVALLAATSLTLGWTGTLAVARGGTGVSSVTTSPTATAFAGWDANRNLSANNFIAGYTTTATAAGNTVLTVGSTSSQFFTGATTQTVTMPVASTLTTGHHFYVVNNSSGLVTINSSGGNAIQVMAAGTTCNLTCILNSGTTAASWYAEYAFQSGSSTGTVNSGTANQIGYYATSGTAISGLTGANSSLLVTNSTGVPAMTASLTNGQLIIGSTGATPTPATLTQGNGITITNGAASITLAVGGALKSFQTFTTGSGTYTKPAGITSILVEVQGAGAGGGGITAGATTIAVASGGGGGGYCRKWYASAAGTYSYAVGAGGAGGVGASNGTAGGNSTFDVMTGGGGNGGALAGGIIASAVGITLGGSGGVATGGDLNSPGGSGGCGLNITTQTSAGVGGGSFWGHQSANQGATTANGSTARPYGGGGGGALGGLVGGTTQNGAAGADGMITVWEFS